MSIIKSLIQENIEEHRRMLVMESFSIDPAVAKEAVSIGSALSGASLAAMWASLGTAATAASVKGLLVAAGFTNPVTLTTIGMVAAGAVAAATVAAGGKVAYNLAKDATRGVFSPTASERAAGDLLDAVMKRDKALHQKSDKNIVKYTASMQKKARKLHDAAVADFKKQSIDKKTYHIYLNLAQKGTVGRLSTLV